ncbi:hypothetical protein B0H19DRAFT_1180895 [Mycena capillaripes]|nr:hypothetical protein B0H19DRAFT_1180895 [Mycena capillaripes]
MQAHRPHTSSFLSNCREFSIYGGTFNHIVGATYAEANARDRSGLRIIRPDEMTLLKQLNQRSSYSLHSAETAGTAVVVKVFHGPLANRNWEETSAASRLFMHPNFLRLLGRSTDESPIPFLIYNGVQETVQDRLISILRGDLQESIRIAVTVVHGVSLGLSYLELQQPSMSPLGAETFDLLFGHNGNIILSFNPEPRSFERNIRSIRTGWIEMLNLLCRAAFYGASQILYHDTVERNAPSALLPFLSPMTLSRGSGSPSENSRQPLRRELIWLPPPTTFSLADIIQQTESFLSRLASSANTVPIPQYQVAAMTTSAHRCTGYQRQEIFISSQMRSSYIVGHATPSLQEVCTICEERVKESDVLRCLCDREDDGVSPTVNCAFCHTWYHVGCVKSDMPRFYCENCIAHHSPRKSVGQSSARRNEFSAAERLPSLDESVLDSTENPIDPATQHDDADSELAYTLRKHECQKEVQQLRDAQFSHEIQLLLKEASGLFPIPHSKPRYKAVPLRLPPHHRPVISRGENEKQPKRNPRPQQLLRERREPQPERPDSWSWLDDGFLADSGDIFEKPKGLDLNPLPTVETTKVIGTTYDPEINHREADSSMKAVWFDMVY